MNGGEKSGMHLLIVILYDGSYLEEIILGLTSISGCRVTMIDGVSGAENLAQSIPMFAEFADMGGRQFCKVMFTCVTVPDPVSRFLDALQSGGVDFAGKALGEVYDIPLGQTFIIEE